MKANVMRDLLLEQYGEYLSVFNWSMPLSDFLGEGYLLGDNDESLSHHNYVCIYSDVSPNSNPFVNNKPEAIWVLDDGRCVFLYEIEE